MSTTVAESRPTYRGLLAVHEFSALFAAHVVSILGDVVATVALTVLIYQRTGSPLLSAMTFTLLFAPQLVGGLLLSALVDRLPARAALVACHLGSAAIAAVMALPGLPVWSLMVLLLGLGLIAPVFSGVRAAILPEVLPDRSQYVLGRSMFRMAAQTSQLVGNALGGALLLVLRPQGALLVDAASFAVSALLVGVGTRARPPKDAGSDVPLLHDSLGGLRAVLRNRIVRRLLLLRWALPFCLVAPEALAAAYVFDLGLPSGAVGLFLAAMPVGAVIGDLVGGRWLTAGWQRRVMIPGALLSGFSLVAFAVRPPLPVALALLVAVGLGFVCDLALDRLVLQSAPERLRGRVLAVEAPILMVAQGVAFTVWGAVGSLLPVATTIAGAGVLALVVVAVLRPPRPEGRSAVTSRV